MKLDTFFGNFGLLADAPNGVQKLREMVLQLAVQGKLVPQDPKDEPASVLLEKIQIEKKGINRSKEHKALKPIDYIEIPYELPSGWEWERFGNVFDIQGGTQPPKSKFMDRMIKGYVRLYQIRDLGLKPVPVYVPKDSVRSFCTKEDVLLARYGASVGKIFMGQNGAYNVALTKVCFNHSHLFNRYVYLLLISPLFQKIVLGFTRSAQAGFNKGNIFPIVLPFPPFEEQKRIVAKVDELMALCDELEARNQQASTNCVQLNDASIHKLLTAREPKKFSNHWQRICDNFDLLYSKPENVNKLRQAILQLAVQGKLVPQDPKDEPASVLLEKIKAEKERLVKEKKIKKPKQFPPIDPSDVPYKLPNGWEWVRLEQTRKTIEYGTSSKASPNDIGIPILRMNNIQNGKLFYDNLKYVKKDIKDLPRLLLKKNDILFNRTNSYELVGKTALYAHDDDLFTFASYLIRVSMFKDWVDPEFTANAMNSYYFRHTQIEPEVTQQCGQANFNGTKLANTLLPLPPSKEQKRIVAKINELMVICDGLEASLSKSQTDCDRLMEAAVAEILAA